MRFASAIAAALAAGLLLNTQDTQRADERQPKGEPVPSTYFGITINSPLSTPWPSIGFGSLRIWDMNISWSDLAPSRGHYDWAKFDAIVDMAHRHGIELVYTFGRTPRWAARSPDAPGAYGPGQCSPPSDMSDWKNFVRAILDRAAGRIKFWEIWNEPQDPLFYCGDIPTLVVMQDLAYKIIKLQNSTLQVLAPSPTGGLGPSWMFRFLSSGGDRSADILTFHGYWDEKASSLSPLIARFQMSARLAGQGEKPMWDTEASWGQNPVGMGDSERAAFLAKYYLLHWSMGIRRLYWYSYDNELGWGPLWTRKGGLLPAGSAYREVRSWMLGATMDRKCAPEGSLNSFWVCGFSRGGGYRALALWTDGPARRYSVPYGFVRYRELTGAQHLVQNGTVLVNGSPILLETEPAP